MIGFSCQPTSLGVLYRAATMLLVTLIVLMAASAQAQEISNTPPVMLWADSVPPAEATATAAPPPIGPQTPLAPDLVSTQGRVLIAILSEFRLFAYEDGRLVHSSIIAHGRVNMSTITGTYDVQRKAVAADLTFRGNTVEDVPFVIAYDDAFAIHGAYWLEQSQWGTRASSGCINLPVAEAAWFYEFTTLGTPVIILE